MEGFLFKKGRGDSSFGRRNWKKRWFVLEGSSLTYYEDLDKTFTPIGLKGTMNIKNSEVSPAEHKDKQFCFVVKPENDSPITFQAPDLKAFNGWMKAISAAAEEEEDSDIEDDYQLLGLSKQTNPDAGEINRAYRKAALRAHPDKGGDMAKFKELQEAYNKIVALLEEEEREATYKYITFTALVTKNHGDSGLGLVVVEDPAKKTIKIKDVLPAVKVAEISAEAEGRLRIGDVLIGVANENVDRMPLTRVAQKLSEFRVPSGSQVKLTFRRRLHLDGRPVEGDAPAAAAASDSGTHEDATPPVATPAATESKSDEPDMDIDENIKTFNDDEEEEVGAPSMPAAPTHQPFSTAAPAPTSSTRRMPPGSVGQVQLLSENEELKAELMLTKDDLESLRQQVGSFLDENATLKAAVTRQSSALARGAVKQRVYLQQVLRQTITAEYITTARRQILPVASDIVAQTPLEVDSVVETMLQSDGLAMSDCMLDGQKMAQRRAVCAVALSDPSQKTLQRWQLQGDSAATKLQRFAEKMNQLALPTN